MKIIIELNETLSIASFMTYLNAMNIDEKFIDSIKVEKHSESEKKVRQLKKELKL